MSLLGDTHKQGVPQDVSRASWVSRTSLLGGTNKQAVALDVSPPHSECRP